MEFDNTENNVLEFEKNENSIKSDEDIYDKAAEILDEYKNDAIFEDDFADLETEKFDLPLADNLFLGEDFAEKQQNDYNMQLQNGRRLMDKIDEPMGEKIQGLTYVIGLVLVIFILYLFYYIIK